MAKQVHIYSTMACDNAYAIYNPPKDGDQRRTIKKDDNGRPMKMVVKGGHGVANSNFITPQGVATSVDKDLYDLLKNDPSFKRHCDRGFLTVSETTKKETKKVVKDMADGDKSKPKTDKDFAKKPKTGSVEE